MQFNTKNLLSDAYSIIKNNKLFVFIMILLTIGLNFLPLLAGDYHNIVNIFVTPLLIIVSLYCSYMLTFQPGPKWNDNFLTALGAKIRKKYFPLMVTLILMVLLIFIGFMLLIIPGMILIIKYSFVFHSLVLKDKGIIEAFKYSWKLTKGQFAQIVILVYAIPILTLGLFWGATMLIMMMPTIITVVLSVLITVAFIVFCLFYVLVFPQALMVMFKKLAQEDEQKLASLQLSRDS